MEQLQVPSEQGERWLALGQLAPYLAHEVNNVLTTILFTSSELIETLGEAAAREEVEIIQREVLRIRRLVISLLDLARPGQGQKREKDLNEVLRQSLACWNGSILDRQIALEEGYSLEPLPVCLVVEQLEQVFSQLIGNALDAMQSGGRLRVRSYAQEGWAIAEFQDSGLGIGEQDLGRIFLPFYTTKREQGALGLGLYICQSYLGEAGGKVEVESQPGQGSTFRVCLPLHPTSGL